MEKMKKSKLNRPSLLQLKDREGLVGAEIGVQWGINARNILKTLHVRKLYLIDPYTAFHEKMNISSGTAAVWMRSAKMKLQPWKNKIEWIREKSVDAAKYIEDNTLDFVYIDGGHLYENVMDDITLYTPKIKMGGLISGHDYNKKQVEKAVDEIFGNKVEIEKCVDMKKREQKWRTDWWVWKDEDIINR